MSSRWFPRTAPRNGTQLQMHIDQRKEQFSHAYVRAVASVAGFAVAIPEVDDDSIDLILSGRGANGTVRSPRLELQLKASSRRDIIRDDAIAFPLPVKNYNDLRPDNVLVPRILVVVLLPDELGEWILHSEEQISLRRCGYWRSLRGLPETANQETITVDLPRTQIFRPVELEQIMSDIGRGVNP
jgi:Domain of unknown function (DUF4365)